MSTLKDYIVLAKLDLDDTSMNNFEVRSRISADYGEVQVAWDYSQNKRDAINRDIDKVRLPWDILLNHSDDMVFTKLGFDEDVVAAFKDFDGLVHFPDQKAGADLITYTMMSRSYYEEEGHIYHPSYSSVFMDNHQHQVAVRKNKYKFVSTDMILHAHPIWGYGIADDLLLRTEEPISYQKDQNTFAHHLANNFGL